MWLLKTGDHLKQVAKYAGLAVSCDLIFLSFVIKI